MLAWSLVTGIVGSSADDAGRVSVLRTLSSDVPPPPGVPIRLFDLADVDIAPAIDNPDEVAQAIAVAYPPLLRDAGVTGTADVRFRVDWKGQPDLSSVEVLGATDDAFGQAARPVVEAMRFRPGMEGGRPVDVRMRMPIVFSLPD
jgi:TonB family protein